MLIGNSTSGVVNTNQDLGQVIDQAVREGVAEGVGAAVAAVGVAVIASEFMQGVEKGIEAALGQLLQGSQPPVSEPSPVDATPPQGLTSDSANGVVTTPGGYKISAGPNQYEWHIQGPGGNDTKVWGDPHVDEQYKAQSGDTVASIAQAHNMTVADVLAKNPSLSKDPNAQVPAGTMVHVHAFDFQKNSTFVLGDGTRINVNTVPWGNAGAHVTGGLQILSANGQMVNVTGIDKGKGQVGSVTNDGFDHVNDFGGAPVFVENQNESDDWNFQGQEIQGGSLTDKSSLQLGPALQPVVNQTQQWGGGDQWAQALVASLSVLLAEMMVFSAASHPYQAYPSQPQQPPTQPRRPQNWLPPVRQDPWNGISQAFRDLGRAFNTLADWTQVSSAASRRVFA